MADGVVKIGRDVVATWLNFLEGNGIGGAGDTNSPRHFINDAVNYLQMYGDADGSGIGATVLRSVVEGGFTGRVWAVHPREERVGGVVTVSSLRDVDGALDLVVICVPIGHVLEVLEDAGLVRSRREGRYKFHDLQTGPLESLTDRWLRPDQRENS